MYPIDYAKRLHISKNNLNLRAIVRLVHCCLFSLQLRAFSGSTEIPTVLKYRPKHAMITLESPSFPRPISNSSHPVTIASSLIL